MNNVFNVEKIKSYKILTIAFLVINFLFITQAAYDEFREVEYSEALRELITAEDIISEMELNGFSVFFMKDSLLESKRYFIGKDSSELERLIKIESDESKRSYLRDLVAIGEDTPSYEKKDLDYFESARFANAVVQRRDQSYKIIDEISLFEERENESKRDGIITDDALIILGEAKLAFDSERYDDAEILLSDANFKLDELIVEDQKLNSAIRSTTGFFILYWWQILIVLALLIGGSIPVTKKVSRYLKEKKLENFKLELASTHELLKQAQNNCFNKKTITTETYRIREKRYKEKTVKIENEIKILEKVLGEKSESKDSNSKGPIGLKV